MDSLLTYLSILPKPSWPHNKIIYSAKNIFCRIYSIILFRHRSFMDNDPKHTGRSTRAILLASWINHCETPA